ncbi:MAG TPA: TMEM175 family protein [Gemmataceae bacterium]|nr:TMEM175 family protein [Gemmataceae bacterium]
MTKGRLEAFSDGVIAIIITIMVLELRPPDEPSLDALIKMAPALTSYLLSFVMLGIYWNNHHHLLQATTQVDGKVLWANLHLLFWLSLTPISTAWMGKTEFAAWPVAIYGIVMLLAGIAYYILSRVLISLHGERSVLADAVGRDFKGIASILLYVAAVPAAFLSPWISIALYVIVAVIWLIPDRRIEEKLTSGEP